MRPVWKSVIGYGAMLALGTVALQWLDYQQLVRSQPGQIYVAVIATAFLALGVFVGARVLRGPQPLPFDGNPNATAALGITTRELAVLNQLAQGQSNKQIAQSLGISPNTVKTHVARIFEKLDAQRRTDAINKARSLGILR